MRFVGALSSAAYAPRRVDRLAAVRICVSSCKCLGK